MPAASAWSISPASLPTPEKTTFAAVSGVAADRALQLASGNNVEARSQSGKHLQDRQVRVGLDGVTDGMFAAAKRLVELPIALANSRSRIDVERSAVSLGQADERNRVGVQLAIMRGSRAAAIGESWRALGRTRRFTS